MAFRLGWKLFVCLAFIYFVRSLYCIQVSTSVFRVLKRNNRIKQCPGSIVNEAKYVGYRVPDGTGKFEGLQRSWLYNQTIESGYSYAIRESYYINFKEPLISFRYERERLFPGIIVHGSRLDILFSNPEFGNWKQTRSFTLVLTVKSTRVIGIQFFDKNEIRVGEYQALEYPLIKMPPAFFTRDIVKLTIAFQTKFAKLMINDKDIWTLPLFNYSLSPGYSGFIFEEHNSGINKNHISVHGIRISFA